MEEESSKPKPKCHFLWPEAAKACPSMKKRQIFPSRIGPFNFNQPRALKMRSFVKYPGEAVRLLLPRSITPLKRGVNELARLIKGLSG